MSKSDTKASSGQSSSGKATAGKSDNAAGKDKGRPAIDIRAIAVSELEIEPFPQVKHEFRVFIGEDAFDRAVERGKEDTSREVGGVLVGVVRRDDAGPYVRVETTIDALHAEEKGAELTFTHDTWQHIHEQMDTVHQGKRVVGWYHTHPGFGIFLSDRDEFIHHSFFDLPFQIAMVYDPKSREHGVFTWHEGSLLRARRYWIGEHEHTWDGARHSAPALGENHTDKKAGSRDNNTSTGSRDADYRDTNFDWLAVALIGLILVLLAGWGGHCYGKQQVLEQATVAVAQAQAAGAKQAVQSLNVEILDTVRAAVDKESVRARVHDIVSELDRALAVLDKGKASGSEPVAPANTDEVTAEDGAAADKGPGTDATADQGPEATTDKGPGAVATHIKQARRKARELLRERAGLHKIFTDFREAARQGNTVEARALSIQRSALGTLYSELARDMAKSGDKQRAIRYLKTAVTVDPAGAERYEKRLQEIDKNAKLQKSTAAPKAPKQ